MLSCESSQVLIADGLYDQLTESDNRDLQEHLQTCAQCRQARGSRGIRMFGFILVSFYLNVASAQSGGPKARFNLNI